ncbi:MAG: glycosyltransferase family 2 protein [Planctomycetota bacterium]|jgi:glycosyltransferase involved in cell wall biosynthesis
MPRVTVILPTFNRRELVTEAIESVRRQTYGDFELVVVDDGSTDGTAETIRERFGDEARLRLVRQENRGVSDARNRGIELSRGELIGFLDSDDLYLPRNLEAQVAALDARPDAHMVTCDARCEGGALNAPTVFAQPHRQAATSLAAMFRGAWGLPSCMLLRREPAARLRFDPSYTFGGDTEFLFRFHRAGYLCFENPEILSVYRRHAEAQLSKEEGRTQLTHIRVMETYLADSPFPDDTRFEIHRRKARYLAQRGRWREARPHCWAWWKRRPGSRRAWAHLARSLLSRSQGPRG